MQVMGQGNGDIHEQTKAAMGASSNSPVSHDFFNPLNSMDPHQKSPSDAAPIPKFKWKIFLLSGLGTEISEQNDYTEVMNKIAEGVYQQLSEKTYHTSDGGIKVFVRWLEFPDKKVTPTLDSEPAVKSKSPTSSSKKVSKKVSKKKSTKKTAQKTKEKTPFYAQDDNNISEEDFNM